jgi:hypothetical protein
MSDLLIGVLADLPAAEPDPAKAERIRRRCRTLMARQRPRRTSSRGTAAKAWQPFIAVLGAAYLTEVFVLALRLSHLP